MSNSSSIYTLVTAAVDEIARHDPQRTFAEFLEPAHLDTDLLVLTFADFANAVDRLSWWLKGKSTELGLETFDAVTYIGFPDLRYYVILLAAAKCQLKARPLPSILPAVRPL